MKVKIQKAVLDIKMLAYSYPYRPRDSVNNLDMIFSRIMKLLLIACSDLSIHSYAFNMSFMTIGSLI